MSNTATVTPYESSPSTTSGTVALAGAVCVAGVAAAAAVASWLLDESDEDRRVSERLAQTRRREITDASRLRRELSRARIESATLHVGDARPILRAAESLGFQDVSSTHANGLNASCVLLRDAGGSRLVVESSDGRVKIHAAPRRSRAINRVVRQHNTSAAIGALQAQGYAVRTAHTASGELQILARPEHSGAAVGEVRAQVRADGTTHLDVEKTKGEACQRFVHTLANSLGGVVTDLRLKNEYYQLPGEPTRVDVGS